MMRIVKRLFPFAVAITVPACGTSGAVLTPGTGVSSPILVNNVHASYTPDALASGVEGRVLLDCVVRANGTVGEVRVVRSLDAVHGLDAEAIQAVKKWTFRPAMRRGKPVAVRVPVEISFTLR